MERPGHQLVVAIVAEELAAKVMDAARDAGGRAVTVVRGRGRDLVRPPTFFGMPIEPSREILYLVTDHASADRVMDAIRDAGELLRPGRGLAFAIELSRVDGLLPPLDAPTTPGGRHGT